MDTSLSKETGPLDVSYHVMLLHEAGFIVGEDLSLDDGGALWTSRSWRVRLSCPA